MRLLTFFQNSNAYDTGYSVGYILAKALPFIILVVVLYFIYKLIKKKSNK